MSDILPKGAAKPPILPTARHDLFDGSVVALVFGKPWDYARLRENDGALTTVRIWADLHKVRDVYAPDPSFFNARVVDPDEFREKMTYHGINIYHGVRADGVRLKPGDAFFIASGDCPTFIARLQTGEVIAAHAGRDCLIDRNRLRGENPRFHESVVFAAMECDSELPGSVAKVQTALICGIGPWEFGHPFNPADAESDNRKMVDDVTTKWGNHCVPSGMNGEGRLSLSQIVQSQLRFWGFSTHPDSHFCDGVDTYSAGFGTPQGPLYHSHRRGDKKTRNGVMVMRLR